MRLGAKSTNDFILILNKKNEEIQQLFVEKILNLTKNVDVNVMLADSTIIVQKTFDPLLVRNFFQKVIGNISNWSIQEVSISKNEEIRRLFTKFECREGNYLIAGQMSLQYHTFLYYKPVQQVIENQKELAKILDLVTRTEKKMADDNDQAVLKKLKEMGYKNFDNQKLFEIFYNDDDLRERILKEIEEQIRIDLKNLLMKKTKLLNELDNLLIETYQTTSVLIDETKLISGEDGCQCNFDIEFIRNNIKEGQFDPRKISKPIQESIVKRLETFFELLKIS